MQALIDYIEDGDNLDRLLARNGRPASFGISGRIGSESVPGMGRNQWADCAGICTWTAKVGFGALSALQATSNLRPTYVTNVQNGKPVVRFSGANGVLLESTETINMSTPNTIIVVAKDNGTSQVFGGVFSLELYMSVFSGGSYYWLDTSGGNVAACTVPATNVFRVITAQYTQNSTTNSKVFYNGTLYSSSSNGSGNTSAGLGRVELGGRAWGGNASRIFKGDIAEVIVYSRAIDDGARAQVEAYLTAKWGL